MLSAGRVLGALVLVKGGDLALTGSHPALLAVFLAGGVLLVRQRSGRTGWLLVLVGGLALLADAPIELRRQHLVLLVGIALVGTVTRDDGERLLLWRTQLSALYGIAVLAKLNEALLSGTVLAEAVRFPLPLPVLIALGVGLLGVEALLAVTPWVPRLRIVGTAVAASLHGVALLVVAGGPLVTLRLLVFGSAAVLLHATSAGRVHATSAGRERAHR